MHLQFIIFLEARPLPPPLLVPELLKKISFFAASLLHLKNRFFPSIYRSISHNSQKKHFISLSICDTLQLITIFGMDRISNQLSTGYKQTGHSIQPYNRSHLTDSGVRILRPAFVTTINIKNQALPNAIGCALA